MNQTKLQQLSEQLAKALKRQRDADRSFNALDAAKEEARAEIIYARVEFNDAYGAMVTFLLGTTEPNGLDTRPQPEGETQTQ